MSGTYLNHGQHKIPAQQEPEIVAAYLAGESAYGIQQRFGLQNVWVIYNILARAGVQRRSYGEARRTHVVDHAAFDILTDESAYWIGFLMADGCVHSVRRTMLSERELSLSLGKIDEDHVESFRSFLKSDYPIYPDRTQRGISITSPGLCSALIRYGVVPRKSFTARAADVLALNRHFWRGVMDGDGCLWIEAQKYTYSHFELVGASSVLMEQFAAYVRSVAPYWRGGVVPQRQYKRVVGGASVATEVITELYRDCTVALPRKLLVARAVMELGLPERRWCRKVEAA